MRRQTKSILGSGERYRPVRIPRSAVALAAGLMLSSCAQWQAERDAQQAAAIAANDDGQCRSYGAAPGSQAYIQCRMNLDNQRAQMRTALASQLIGRMTAPPPQTVNV